MAEELDYNVVCIAHYHAGRYNMFTPTDGGIGPFLEEVFQDPVKYLEGPEGRTRIRV